MVGRAQLAGLAGDLAAWTDDFYSGAPATRKKRSGRTVT